MPVLTAVSGGWRCQVHHWVFRVSGGRLLGRWAGGLPVLQLTTTGRRTGARRTTMLASPLSAGDGIVVVASNGGAPRHPDWYANLVAHPEVDVMTAGRSRPMRARVLSAAEAAPLWPRIVDRSPAYGRYRERAGREIPLVVLEPVSDRR